MLFAIIGAIWTISILCMTFAGVYLYNLHRNQGAELTYAWDKFRLAMLYVLGVAVFYLGTARLVSRLSGLIMYQLNQRPIPLWYPDRWLTLAAMCAVIAFMIGLLNRGEREEGILLESNLDDQFFLPEIRSLPAPVIRPEDSTTYLKPVTNPLAPINILDEETPEWGGFLFAFRNGAIPALLTTLGICVVAVIGWLVFSQSGVLDRIGPSDSTITMAKAAQSVVPEIGPDLLNNVVDTSMAVPARPTEDPSVNLGRSALPIAVESPVVEPSAVEPLPAATTAYTSSIPITLVSATDANSPSEQIDPQPAAIAPAAIRTPTIQTPVVVVQGSYSVNARFSPTVDSAIIKVLPSGATVPIREWSPNREWILVILDDGRSAWVASWVVEVVTLTS